VTGDLAERASSLPGLERLLPALEGLPPVHLVGGAVRDLLREAAIVDLDLVVLGDAPEVARTLAERLGGSVTEHDRFGTATLHAGELLADLVTARRERYPRPGALPEVEPAGLVEDLARRDFTVNAMALGLSAGERGRLADPHGGRADLDAGLVRVLHDRSFADDPTRLLRAVRYEARLEGALELSTERLARDAVAAGALGTVSGPRVRDELLDLLAEREAPGAVARLGELGIAGALDPALHADADLVAGAALGSMETGANRALACLAAICCADPDAAEPFVEGLGLTAPSREAVLRAARRGPALAAALRGDGEQVRGPAGTASGEPPTASALHALLAPEPPEALALALALGAPAEPLLRFLSQLRDTTLEIDGNDLIAAGAKASPPLGLALARTLARKLDGEISGREQELRAALDELDALGEER
jgi:tRNA nucleotidyltransferase (CCA-adding enzyme)